jgi:hypothetical protein
MGFNSGLKWITGLFLFLSGGAVAAALNSMWIGYYQYISTQWAILAVVLGAVAIYIETRNDGNSPLSSHSLKAGVSRGAD